ncbi:GUN4 domain-containing protein [Sphaerospermopsis aphanizomenoides BCCUSP55]|uniref:serine/threonine-protein kinase n=1 Tax=Sphaerospermopsis aphanizomenoides TaxID=459663 RepID=UPI000AFAF6C2|nr:serine/threonine-protein kinase [Sphaerospermopsis aphanizomenoides]MBK1988559.1 GUN4 domain-containing protein [Sphaerospermopsis aphanizomenoides BCCUSP55]
MSCCTACIYLYNPNDARFCIKCGKPLLLKERYFPLYPIGSGGFGRTFLAIDEHIPSKPKCVIKQFYFPDANQANFAKAVELFRQEAARLDELRHPQIPQLLAHFEQDNQLYLVQELIVGQNLAQELQAQGVFSEVHIWQLLTDLLPVLQFIHSRQVIHRDIKPANIMRRYTCNLGNETAYPPPISNAALSHKGSTMTIGGLEAFSFQPKQGKTSPAYPIKTTNLSRNSAPGELVLIDFGVAKQITATALAHTGTTVGSAEYIAPEQMRGKALPASDLYSLGVTCIYLLTGVSPFELFDVTSDRWVWQNYLLPENPVSERLSAILNQLLQNALSQRYKSATEVLAALNTKAKPIQQLPVNALYSAAGVDYKRLNELLKAKKWQQADQETWVVMRQALSKPVGKYLFNSDLEKLPCEDLQMIDQLWTKYSQGRFGFSVQVQIYESCGRDYGQFCATVGWDLTKSSSSTQNLFFIWSSVPKGNLPSHPWVGGTKPWEHMNTLGAVLLKMR